MIFLSRCPARALGLLSVELLLAALALQVLADPARAERPEQVYELFVRFRSDAVSFPAHDRGNGAAFTAPLEDAVVLEDELADILGDLGARSFATVAPSWRHLSGPVLNHRGESVQLVDFTDLYLVSFSGSDPDYGAALLSDSPSVVYAYAPHAYVLGDFPDDPLFPQQWNLHNTGQTYEGEDCEADLDVNAPEAWEIAQGSGTKIGIVDSGVVFHPDLEDYLDINLSYSYYYGNPPWYVDMRDHGTKVAGVALAGGDNGRGIASLANTPGQGTPIVALKVLEELEPGPQDDAVIAALEYITSYPYPQILVTNHSWFASKCFHATNPLNAYSPALRDAFRNAYLLDISSFACAGNGGGGCWDWCNVSRCWQFPAAFSDYCFGVRGITCSGQNPGSSQAEGHWVDATAPSVLPSKTAAGGYGVFSMCSAATPGAASLAGLLLRRNPDLTNEDIYNVIRLTARDLGEPGHDETFGAGLIRADSALLVLSPPVVLFHDTAEGYASSHVEDRPQWFKNLTGLTAEEETWERFFARVHKLQIEAEFPGNAPAFNPIRGVWGRGRGSAGARDADSLDVRLWAADLRVDPGSVSPEGCVLETHTYEIYDPDEVTFRCWYPVSLDLRPVCTPFPSPPRFNYSYLADTTSVEGLMGELPGPATAERTREAVPGGQGEWEGWNRVEVFDAGGRRIRVLVDESGAASGGPALEWDGRDAFGRRAPAGVYFIVSRDRNERATRKMLLLGSADAEGTRP